MFWTNGSFHTVQIQIRMHQKKQSDQSSLFAIQSASFVKAKPNDPHYHCQSLRQKSILLEVWNQTFSSAF